MGWTYNGPTSNRDKVRLLIGDTISTRPLLADEEIQFFLASEMNIYTAAARCCETLVARAGNIRSKKIRDLAITYDPMAYQTLAATLFARGSGYQVPYAGGISVSDKVANASDPDAVAPAFARGIEDNPWAPAPSIPAVNNSDTLLTIL